MLMFQSFRDEQSAWPESASTENIQRLVLHVFALGPPQQSLSLVVTRKLLLPDMIRTVRFSKILKTPRAGTSPEPLARSEQKNPIVARAWRSGSESGSVTTLLGEWNPDFFQTIVGQFQTMRNPCWTSNKFPYNRDHAKRRSQPV